jgi:hypothetical protein
MMGIEHVSPDILMMQYDDKMRARGGFTYAIFQEMVRELASQFRKEDGRYYVLLSLEEAEHFRGVIHARQGMPLLLSETQAGMVGTKTSAALWLMGDSGVTMLGSTFGFRPSISAHHSSMVNCFRFLNSESHFDNRGLTVLLRVLENNSCEEREKWWTDVRACRRRRQISWDGATAVGTVFSTVSEYEFMEYKAVVERIKYGLQEKGLLVFDAFRAFNSSNTGLLSCSELYGGMDFLSIPFTADQIYDLVRKLAIHNDVSVL